MDFTLTKQETEFRNELVSWLHNQLPKGWLEGERVTATNSIEYVEFLKDWQKMLSEGNWAGISWPKEYGGRGASLIEEVIYAQEMARVKAPAKLNIIGEGMVGPTLIQIGTEKQKKKYIHKILSGEEIWCQGFSEPNAGSDLAAIKTTAVKKGNKWIINGQKIWTSFAHVADRMFLLARTDNSGKKHQGITAFMIDMNQKEIDVRPIHHMNGKSDFNEVFLTDAVAYEDDIVGEINEGWKVALLFLSHERTSLAERLFSLQFLLPEVVKMTKKINRNGALLIEDPLVRDRLADFYTRAKAALFNYYRNVTKRIQTGHPGAESSMDKLNYTELYKEIMNFMISIQGVSSTLWQEDAYLSHEYQELYFTTFGWALAGGSAEIQRNVIAERILGLPKDLK